MCLKAHNLPHQSTLPLDQSYISWTVIIHRSAGLGKVLVNVRSPDELISAADPLLRVYF